MVILVTGSEGFIGKSLINKLNELNYSDIITIDDENKKVDDNRLIKNFFNWKDYQKNNYFDFLDNVDFVYHLGANSSTREKFNDIKDCNVSFTSKLFSECCKRNIPVVFASSGAIYGSYRGDGLPNPLTDYGITKLIGENLAYSYHFPIKNDVVNIVCLRYHNVYGHTESHKGNMASIISKWVDNHIKGENKNILFSDSSNIKRDFVHVEDINKINIMFLDYFKNNHNIGKQIVYDVGTGVANSFLDVANNIIKHTGGEITYIDNPFNEQTYQFYTQADIRLISDMYLKTYNKVFEPINISEGIKMVFKQKNKVK